MASAPLFYTDVRYWYQYALLAVILIIELVALVNCVTRRKDAFPAVGNATKGDVGADERAVRLRLDVRCCWIPLGPWFGVLGVIISAVYLLDVRPAIRDALNGRGGW